MLKYTSEESDALHNSIMPSSTHALFIAYPAQGHVLPLLELAHRFADHGFAVTFVNTDHIHGQLVAASPELEAAGQQDDGAPPPESGQVRFVSVSDGIPPDVDRNNLGTLTSALMSSLPPAVEHMIQNGNFRCMVVDYAVAWVLGVAKKSGMRTATLWPSCAAVMAAALHLPELIADGILDKDGNNSLSIYTSTDLNNTEIGNTIDRASGAAGRAAW